MTQQLMALTSKSLGCKFGSQLTNNKPPGDLIKLATTTLKRAEAQGSLGLVGSEPSRDESSRLKKTPSLTGTGPKW